MIEFVGGMLVASIIWFIIFTGTLVWYTLKLSDGLERRALAVKDALDDLIPYLERYDDECDRRLDVARAAVDQLLPQDDEVPA